MLYTSVNGNFILSSFQSDIDAISSWTSSAGLSLNQAKTELLVLSRKFCSPSFVLKVTGSPIIQVNSIKNLISVTFFSNLPWRQHINNVCSRAKHQVGFLYRNFSRAVSTSLLQLYKLLVLPILDYCLSVWDPHLFVDTNLLESVQSFTTKIITKCWKSSAGSHAYPC